jgi:hypothetical protein
LLRPLLAALGGLLGLLAGLPAPAQTPSTATSLPERVDQLIESQAGGPIAAPASDAEFLRRIWLDLAGVIPTADQARAFLHDPSPDKRQRLIDQLLDSPAFVRHFADVLDVSWMERRPAAAVPEADWLDFLFDSVARHTPYDALVRQILAADGSQPDQRGPARFLLDRGADPHLLTRDIGRLFLGRDLQCAQCHDHPLIDDYKQAHYYGLFAYLSRTSTLTGSQGRPTLSESADGDVTFKSVFKKNVEHRTDPRLLDGPPRPDPPHIPGRDYWAYPLPNRPSIPRYSRRAQLGPDLTASSTPDFARNAANRLWALLFGRGLVHPLDFSHADNPPSHPELLDLLAQELHNSGYDYRFLLRCLASTRAYQRACEPPPDLDPEAIDPARFTVAAIRPLSPEQLGWSVMQALGIVEAQREQIQHRLLVADGRLRDIATADAPRARLVALLAERQLDQSLRPSLAPFRRQFAPAAGQPDETSQPTVHQALFLANGDPIQGWLNPNGRNLTTRLAELSNPDLIADELYLAVLSRYPTRDERLDVSAYLASHADHRPRALRDLAWALLSSAEFRFNH